MAFSPDEERALDMRFAGSAASGEALGAVE
jgi:hypothetical protein